MAEIRHLENRHDVIFSAKGGPIWIKFRRLVQNDMSTAVMSSKSKPDVEFQYGGCLVHSKTDLIGFEKIKNLSMITLLT